MIEPTQPGHYYHSGTLPEIPIPPPPPPPEYYMQQRTSKVWRYIIPVFILLIGGIMGILFYPILNALINPVASPAKTTPYMPISLQSTATPQPNYVNDMNSLNYYRLFPAWSKALDNRDWNTISNHTDTGDFELVCGGGPCHRSNWTTTIDALEAGYFQLSIPLPYKLIDSTTCQYLSDGYYPPPTLFHDGESIYVNGTFKNDYQHSGIEASDKGSAMFQFTQIEGNVTLTGYTIPTQTPLGTMILEAVYTDSSC